MKTVSLMKSRLYHVFAKRLQVLPNLPFGLSGLFANCFINLGHMQNLLEKSEHLLEQLLEELEHSENVKGIRIH